MTQWKLRGGGEREELVPDIMEGKGGRKEVLRHKGNKVRGFKAARRDEGRRIDQ